MLTVYDKIPKIDEMASRRRSSFPDITEEKFWEIYDIAKPYSMIHVTGFYNLFSAIRYVSQRNIQGDVVECGVWYGGASIFAALACEHFGISERRIYLFDTFAGFPKGSKDKKLGKDVSGPSYANFRKGVEANIDRCGIANGRTILVEGPVEETLASGPLPERISVLRLDTDYYPSTAAEMRVLYPRLSTGGVLIVDDYGLYEGSRKAVDEALAEHPILLNRIDTGVRAGLKL
ncbi:MAG: TylF/MycF/NovP-related O-methyltransferase [Hyphomicrobiaceae bacterium]